MIDVNFLINYSVSYKNRNFVGLLKNRIGIELL